MSTATLNDCTQLDTTLLERVNYFPRQLLTADDMTADQQYFIAKLRRHNRYLHGWGVVCGLAVTIAPTAKSPWMVQISPGYALGPYGDEIYVPNAVNLDLAQCGPGAATDPCSPGTLLMTGTAKTGSLIYVAIRYEECFARPVQTLPGGCGCNSNSCEPSRISDSYEIDCLGTLPPSAQPDPQGPSLCDYLSGRALVECPSCPTDPWIVLAQVQLPTATGSTLPQSNLDNSTYRRRLFSTAVIQEQVRLCCCTGNDLAPARVTSITPANQTVFTNGSQIPSSILITFNKHLVATSVNKNSILVVLNNAAGVPSVPVAGSVTYDDINLVATFTPLQPFTIPGIYQVTVVGTGPNQITDSDNLALDGNADGAPGGNFLSQFTVQIAATPTPTPTAAPTPTPTPTPQPTQAPVPLAIALQGPNPVPTLTPSQAAVGDLQISVTGGTPGQKIKADITVVLSQNLAQTAATDTAVCKSATGAINGSKGPNSYTFSGVVITTPGATSAFSAIITNMKVNVVELARQGGGDVVASVSMTSATALPPVVPSQAVVAHVNRG